MKKVSVVFRAVAVLVLFSFAPSMGLAQATRTWVSGVGDDANPGSRTAPCKTFAGAISKTAAGGEIDCLDPGGFGAITITKSITIDGAETFGSILAAGTNGVVINAGVNDVVTIRNLSINGAGTGVNGIRFLAGAALHIENCVIFGFTQKGVDCQTNQASRLFIQNTTIRENSNAANGGAVFIKPGAAGSLQASLDRAHLERNTFGLRAEDRSTVTVSNSVISGNGFQGFVSISATQATTINVESCTVDSNGSSAVRSVGGLSTIRLSNVMVVNNGTGLDPVAGGAIISFVNNRFAGNTTPGAPTGTIAQQ